MTSPNIVEVDVDDNEFLMYVDGVKAFVCEREYITVRGVQQRGYWLLKMVTAMGPLIVERDQYSNDLRERVQIHVEERKVYGNRFRLECSSRAHYDMNINDFLSDVSALFPGHWSGYYDEHNRWAVLEKD